MAESQPQTLAIAQPSGRPRQGRIRYRHYTYRELNAESNSLARGLERIGIHRGVRTVLMVTPSLEFYALTFALFKVGAVIVLIDPGMGTKNLGVCLAEARPEAFIGIPKAHVARLLFGWGRGSLRMCVTVGRRFGWSGWTLEQVRRLGGDNRLSVLANTRADEMAAILFTSGSTGIAKGVVYTHGIFAAQVESLRRLYGIEPGEVDLPTFPLFGLFGPALGMTSIIPQMDPTRPAQRRSTKDPRRHSLFWGDESVRLARPYSACRPLRCYSQNPAADAAPRHLRRRPGAVAGHPALRRAARRWRASSHALRRDRSTARLFDRQRRDSTRNAAAHRRGRRHLCRPAR